MTRLTAALGIACLIVFAVVWPPAAWLITGLGLLLLALIRADNERRTP